MKKFADNQTFTAATHLDWIDLPLDARASFTGKLAGLYNHESDAAAFDALAVDKQQALLIFHERLSALDLWTMVRRISNVYGEGGVGMNFTAAPALRSMLEQHTLFTALFATHKNSTGGFLERRRPTASLHFLYSDDVNNRIGNDNEVDRCWSVHFDAHSPVTSLLSAWRHLWHERVRGETPDWRRLKLALLRGKR